MWEIQVVEYATKIKMSIMNKTDDTPHNILQEYLDQMKPQTTSVLPHVTLIPHPLTSY